MPWRNGPEERKHSGATYGSAWRKARAAALRRAGRRCERCGSRKDVQVDHVVPVSQGGSHDLANLQVLCGPCHRRKTAAEGGGYRSKRKAADPAPVQRTRW